MLKGGLRGEMDTGKEGGLRGRMQRSKEAIHRWRAVSEGKKVATLSWNKRERIVAGN